MEGEQTWQFNHPSWGYSFVFDDDGRVVYGYLKEGDKIVADIWLYNKCPTPQEPEWTDKPKLPCANPADYALENPHEPIESIDEVFVEWSEEEPIVATVHIKGVRWAKLTPGAKPGWCVLARKDGPLAKVLGDEEP